MSSPGTLHQSLIHCRGVGPAMQEKLNRLGLNTLGDVLFHLPLRYENRGQIVPIGECRHGQRVLINASVEFSEVVYRRKRMLLVRVGDGTGMATLRFFHFRQTQIDQLKRGTKINAFGEVQITAHGIEFMHPEYSLGEADISAEGIRAVYPTTDGIHQATIRRLVKQSLNHLDELPQLLPKLTIFEELPSLTDALKQLHQPNQWIDMETHPAVQRLVVEELTAHHLSLMQIHTQTEQAHAPVLNINTDQRGEFLQRLGFTLTSAQQRVIETCLQDMSQSHPMQRLLQGDVGSGKTAVAAALIHNCLINDFSAAFMAPTELLAEQHCKELIHWFTPLGFNVHLITSQTKNIPDISHPAVFVGTHALFQNNRTLPSLGLTIIDEQHRFGVNQRLALKEKGKGVHGYPHQLIMTATPIPRSLAMTAYADLDYSVIDELPPGRKPVNTVAISNLRRDEIVQRIQHVCAENRQVYWVCTLIDESEKIESQAAETTAQLLKESLPDLAIELVHGQLPNQEKTRIMQRFAAGDVNILVATTVIEVGVNVPNASLMIIENAERLGLAQLHQLRGRVGRGTQESACVLMYQTPLGQIAKKRINAMRETNDGFKIAQMDLELRGPGEVLGTKQSGEVRFKIADLIRDQHWVPHTQALAKEIMQKKAPQCEALIQRWFPNAGVLSKV